MNTLDEVRELKELYLKEVKFGDLQEKFGLNSGQMFAVDLALNTRHGNPLIPNEEALLDILPEITEQMKSYEIAEIVNRFAGGKE